MADNQKEIDNLNNKLVEFYGKLNRIQYDLDKMDINNDVEARSTNKVNSREVSKHRRIQTG